jgi:hypothetical protein
LKASTRTNVLVVVASVLLASVDCHRRETLAIAPASMAAAGAFERMENGETVLTENNSSLVARVKFRSVGEWELAIEADSVSAGGKWPILGIEVGGVSYGGVYLDPHRRKEYRVRFRTEPGYSDIKLRLILDGPSPAGRRATIANLQVVPL